MITATDPKRKTTIEVDEELLARAQEVLGTKGLKDTVDRALHEVWRAEMRRQLLEQLRTGEGIDVGPEMLEETRARWTSRDEP
jgi:Arc/MetJ family transcription regulator